MKYATLSHGRRQPDRSPASRRILIADIEPQVQQELQRTLIANDYRVVGLAGTAAAARAMTRRFRPDLLLLDLLIEQEIAQSEWNWPPNNPDAPVVIVTAYSRQEISTRGGHGGIGSYLIKPIRPEALRPAIEVAVTRTQELRAMQRQAAELAEALRTRDVVARAKSLLMEQGGLSEAEAFRYLQRQSMNRRMEMRKLAVELLRHGVVEHTLAPEAEAETVA